MSERRPARPRHPGGRGGHRDPAGRRLPAPHPRGAGRRRARPTGPVRRPGRRRRVLRHAAAAVLLDPQGQPQRHLRRHGRDRRVRRRRGHPLDRRAPPHDTIDVVGPLGKAFPLPTAPVPASSSVAATAVPRSSGSPSQLRERGCHVEMVLGAASEDRLFGVVEARRSCDGVTVTTDDGSAGQRGWVSDVLPDHHRPHRCGRRLRLRPHGDAPLDHRHRRRTARWPRSPSRRPWPVGSVSA